MPHSTRPFAEPPAKSASPTRQHETFLDVFESALQHGTLSTSVFSTASHHAKSEERRRDFNFLGKDRFVVKHYVFGKSSFFLTEEGLIAKATGL